MNKKVEVEIARIEATQRALRVSIEATKGLAAETESLLQKHKPSFTDRSTD